MRKGAKNLTRTAVLLALLIVFQYVTKPLGQLVTGSCVNAVLAVGAWMLPLPYALVIAVISPFLASLLGIGPQLLPIIIAISVGNTVYCAVLHLLDKNALVFRAVAGIVGAALKFLTLYLLIVKLLCSVLSLPAPQVQAFTATFSYPQLFTALIGAAAALLIVPLLKKALNE